MSKRRNGPSRRAFLQTAGAAAGAIIGSESLWPLTTPARAAATTPAITRISSPFMIRPDTAWDWANFKSKCGPTYAGGAGWKRYTGFLLSKMPEFGAVDLDFVEIPYDHYIVDDWPDRKTHLHGSGVEVEKLVSDGKPVDLIASYGMTSGSTPREGITAPMLYCEAARPPAKEQMAGKILVFATEKYPEPPYSNAFLESYTLTDYEWRSPGKWHELFTPPPTSVTSSYHSRWVWSQLNRMAAIGIAGRAAGMVVVYDLSPGAAFGLAQRSVYTPDGKAGLGAKYVNCPTLALDRVRGAKVIADAKAGKTATLTLIARFERNTGRAMLAYLPGKNYGTPQDEQVLLATHTDAMSLIEENGGLGMLGIMSYFNHVSRASRPRTLIFYFDCRHFMPGGEPAWPQFDYYTIHPEKLKSIVATIGMEHLGGRQTIETGEGGNDYVYSQELPENGGVITSLMDLYNNNMWFVEKIAKAATDNHWPRVDVKSGPVAPGVNGGLQGAVRSPMNKGRAYKIPGIGLAGDWPGGWTQTYAQVDTEAGPHGFDKDYFVQQVAGLSQLTGELMLVNPKVIDLGWGELKSVITNLTDADFASGQDAAYQHKTLLAGYETAFRRVEAGANQDANSALRSLAAYVGSSLTPEKQAAVKAAIDAELSKLS